VEGHGYDIGNFRILGYDIGNFRILFVKWP
jgi:hypothetical protein